MEEEGKWPRFLKEATSQEVFSKIGKVITFNDKLTKEQKQVMTEKIWGMWEDVQKEKKYPQEVYQSEWWSKPE